MKVRYSLKLILWSYDVQEDGKHAIYLRISVNGDRKYLHTNCAVLPSQWDEKKEQVRGTKTDPLINAQIADLKAKVLKKITELIMAEQPVTAKDLKAWFTGGDMADLFEFADQFIKEVRHKRAAGTLENYRKHLLKIELYNGSRKLPFAHITTSWLGNYEDHLRTEGLTDNYIHALFKTLKTIFNAAIKKGIIKDYPFHRYENPVYKAPVKDYLSIAEIHALEDFADDTTNKVLKQTAVYFLLGVATGLRISDWRRFKAEEHVQNGRVLLRAKKNNEWVSMPVNGLLQRNLQRMKALPLTIEEPTINEKIKAIMQTIGVRKRITSHSARHTFAVSLCADRGVSCETCAELMGITVSTCVENYYRVSSRKIDTETLKAWSDL